MNMNISARIKLIIRLLLGKNHGIIIDGEFIKDIEIARLHAGDISFLDYFCTYISGGSLERILIDKIMMKR